MNGLITGTLVEILYYVNTQIVQDANAKLKV